MEPELERRRVLRRWRDAGISSDNPAVGHLGDIGYKVFGVGFQWLPFDGGINEQWFPLVKFGASHIQNTQHLRR